MIVDHAFIVIEAERLQASEAAEMLQLLTLVVLTPASDNSRSDAVCWANQPWKGSSAICSDESLWSGCLLGI